MLPRFGMGKILHSRADYREANHTYKTATMRYKILLLPLFLFPLFASSQVDTVPDLSKLLNYSLEELMNIEVVSATGFMQTTSEAPATIRVITAKQIKERGYEQLEDALRDVPGIDFIHLNGYAPTLIYFRGMYGAENLRALLMIDGMTENNILGSNDMAGPTYSLHNVERIEIIWGPVSALYGANAFGGVINIITKRGAEINGLQFEQGFGSFNTSFSKLALGYRKNNLEFSFAGTLYNTDGPRFTNRDPQYSASYVDKAHSFNSAASYYGKKTRTTLGFRMNQTPMGWGTYSNSPTMYLHLPPQGNGNLGILGVLQRDVRGERSGLINSYLRTWYIQNEFKPNDKWNFLINLRYRETGQDEDSYIYVTVDGRKMIRSRIASYSNRVAGDGIANYILSDKHKFSVGVQSNQDNVEAGARNQTFDMTTNYFIDGRDTVVNINSTFLPRVYDIRNNLGGFFQYVLSTELFGKTNITVGARYDHNSYFGNAFSPRIAIVNKPGDKITFKFQFGSAFRSPSNLEIYQVPGRTFPLKQEKLNTYEVNAIYNPSKYIRLQVNGFYNKLTDVIILSTLANPLIPDKNPGLFKIKGVELITEMVFNNNISGFANFTYMDTWGKNLQTGVTNKLPAIAKFKGNFGLTANVEDFFTISFSGNWVGERPVQRTNPYGPVKGYLLGNCFISTSKILNEKITASIGIRNLFDVKWLDPGFRTADGLLYATVLEQPGINATFKVGITF